MDDNFFKKLDEALTNVGSDKYWERKIGGHVVWLSPVPFKCQHKVNELLTNPELGTNVIGEVKRMTMSFAIVGFDGLDLRPYRDDTPQFPVMEHREKKQVKVALHKYLSYKMEEWGTEWIDSAFEVFADIMETIKKENLKEVKFENARDKREELAELEEKVRDLRIELGLPLLVEVSANADAPPVEKAPPPPEPEEPPPPPFDPFRKLPQAAQAAQPPAPIATQQPVPVPQIPVTPVPRQVPSLDMAGATSSPEQPYVAGRGGDVIESRPVREPLPIELDPVRQSTNPRFKQTR